MKNQTKRNAEINHSILNIRRWQSKKYAEITVLSDICILKKWMTVFHEESGNYVTIQTNLTSTLPVNLFHSR